MSNSDALVTHFEHFRGWWCLCLRSNTLGLCSWFVLAMVAEQE